MVEMEAVRLRAANALLGENAGRGVWSMAAVGAAVIVVTTLVWIYGGLQRSRKRPRGPTPWPLLGNLVEMRQNFDRLNDWFLGYFSDDVKTYSLELPFTINPKMILTVDPVNVEYILTNIQKYGKGDIIKRRFADFSVAGFFVVDGHAWKRHRKIASTEFSTRKIRDHSNTVFREDAVRLANALNRAMVASEPVEFQGLVQRMTLDSICKVAFGVDLGGLSPSLPDVPFAIAFDTAQSLIAQRFKNPFFEIQKALNIGMERPLNKATQEVHVFADNVIANRRLEITAAHNAGKNFEREDLLSKFMAYKEGSEDRYNDSELRAVVIDFLVAGRDTTAVTLAWFMYEMCCHQEIADKIYKEGVEVIGNHTDFGSMAEHLTHDNLARMHYLHAALTESLRLHPPVPRDAKCVLVDDDVLPDGTVVKKGDSVLYVPYSMGRMPFIWGSDALEFNPERFLKDGVFHSVSPFKFTAFQAGPRICLGRDSAYLQLMVTVALIVHFFTFQLVPGQEITYTATLVMPMKNGVTVSISPRQ